MALTLSKNAKAAVDAILSVAGLIAGSLVSGALKLPAPYDVMGPIIGTVVGYLVSDLVTIVDTGQAPTTPIPATPPAA